MKNQQLYSSWLWRILILLGVSLLTISAAHARHTIPELVDKTRKNCKRVVTIAVIDTGIDYNHAKLRDYVWTNKGEIGKWDNPTQNPLYTNCRNKSCNGLDDDGNGFIDDFMGWDFVNHHNHPMDTHGHGTHVAGIITKHSKQLLAQRYCITFKIMALKYYSNASQGYANLRNMVKALSYAIQQKVDIINYSGGGFGPSENEMQAIIRARKAGIIVVAAAGNNGQDNDWIPYYPASYKVDNILAVANASNNGKLFGSSNYGRKSVDLAAKGLNIDSTLPYGQMGKMSGTSQATAQISGIMGVLKFLFPNLSYSQLIGCIVNSADPLRGRRKLQIRGGLVNLRAAQKACRKMLK